MGSRTLLAQPPTEWESWSTSEMAMASHSLSNRLPPKKPCPQTRQAFGKWALLWWNISLLNCTLRFALTLEDSRINLSLNSLWNIWRKSSWLTLFFFSELNLFSSANLKEYVFQTQNILSLYTLQFSKFSFFHPIGYRAPTFCLFLRMGTISHLKTWDSSSSPMIGSLTEIRDRNPHLWTWMPRLCLIVALRVLLVQYLTYLSPEITWGNLFQDFK